MRDTKVRKITIDWAFDNVSVYNTIEIGGDIPFIAIGLVAGISIALIAIFLIRRR